MLDGFKGPSVLHSDRAYFFMEREYPNGREQKLTNKVMNAVSSVEKDRVESELCAFDLYDALKNRPRFYGIFF